MDILFVENFDNMTANERKEKIKADYRKQYALILGESCLRRLQTEHLMKLHDMEKYIFGQACNIEYICVFVCACVCVCVCTQGIQRIMD